MFNPNQNQNLTDQLKVDRQNLYREETFSDLQMANIKRLIPVTTDGSMDQTRPIMFIGHTQIMTQAGALPVQSPIEATTLEEAMEKFPQAINQAVEKMIEEAKEMQREQASKIVVPGADDASKIISWTKRVIIALSTKKGSTIFHGAALTYCIIGGLYINRSIRCWYHSHHRHHPGGYRNWPRNQNRWSQSWWKQFEP